MDILEVLKNRVSVKKFLDKQVDEESLNKIIDAGLFAASGKNKQCVKLLVVTNKEVVKELSKLNASILGVDIDPFYNAPCVIVVFADRNIHTFVEDGSLVMGNMMNEAFSIGVDSCWIHRANEIFENSVGRSIATKYGIPESYRGIGNLVLGYRAVDFKVKDRVPDRVIYVK